LAKSLALKPVGELSLAGRGVRDERRRDRVDPDAVAFGLDGQRAGEHDDGGHRGADDRLAGGGRLAGVGRDIDDAAAPLALHHRQDRSTHEDRGEGHGVEQPGQVLDRGVVQQFGLGVTRGRVDQDVDAAHEFRDPGRRRLDRCHIGGVHRDEVDGRTRVVGSQACHGLRSSLRVATQQHQVGHVQGGQLAGGGQADPGCAADDGDATLMQRPDHDVGAVGHRGSQPVPAGRRPVPAGDAAPITPEA
jgi:hypothetical protein